MAVVSAGALLAVSVDDGIAAALGTAWRAGIATIGVWALARELDPDHPSSAWLAATLSIPAWMLFGVPDLIATFTIVMIGRVLLRPAGHPPTWIDNLILIGLGIAVGTTSPGWILGLTLAYAVGRDRALDGERAWYARQTSLLIAAGTTGMAVRSADLTFGISALIPIVDPRLPTLAAVLMVVAGFIGAVTTPPYAPASVGDISKEPLSAKRMQSARRITLLGALAVVALTREAGIVTTASLWISWIGIALVTRRIVPLRLGPDRPR